jgi:hypothetical protein
MQKYTLEAERKKGGGVKILCPADEGLIIVAI